MLAAVGEEAVGEAAGDAVADFIAVALLPGLVVKRLGIGEDDARALAAGYGEQRIGGGEGLAVKEEMNVTARRDTD